MKKNKIFFAAILVLVLAGLYLWGTRDFEVKNSHKNATTSYNWQKRSPITGESCGKKGRRAFAVMLSGNERVRPLAGISKADLVFELPVTVGGINRLMGVYQCRSSDEIGSVRSSREDFIPLALGLDAIYAHWGGSHFALARLDRGIMDNIDALSNRHQSFYRKSGYKRPDDGFTNIERLLSAAKNYGFRLKNQFDGFAHISPKKIEKAKEEKRLTLGYPGEYEVEWHFEPEKNTFFRFRNGTPEVDKLTGEKVGAKNVVVIRASKTHKEGQYVDVHLEGKKRALFFRNGRKFAGKWRQPEDPKKAPLKFLFDSGEDFQFLPGPIWIEVIGPEKEVTWGKKSI